MKTLSGKWSKTILFALATVLYGVLRYFGFAEWTPDPNVSILIDAGVVVVIGIVNFILRKYFTAEPIA